MRTTTLKEIFTKFLFIKGFLLFYFSAEKQFFYYFPVKFFLKP